MPNLSLHSDKVRNMPQIRLAVLIVALFTFFAIYSSNFPEAKAQPGSGRVNVPKATKKASKQPKAAAQKPIKPPVAKVSKPQPQKAAAPSKAVRRPRQVEPTPPPTPEKKLIAEKPPEEKLLSEPEQSQPEIKKETPAITKVTLPRRTNMSGRSEMVSNQPAVSIERIRLYHNIYNHGVKGVSVQISLRTRNLEQTETKATAYFYPAFVTSSFPEANPATTARRETPFVEEVFVPTSKDFIYSNLLLFMPYEELEQVYYDPNSNDSLKLKLQVQIADMDGSLLSVSGFSFMTIR
jgi:hypothetical protein